MTTKPYKYEIQLVVKDGDTVWQTINVVQEQLSYAGLVRVQRAVTEAVASAMFALGAEDVAKK